MNIYYGYSSIYKTISFSVTHDYNIMLENDPEYEIKNLL